MTFRPILIYVLLGFGAWANAQKNEPPVISERTAFAEMKPTERSSTSGLVTFNATTDVDTITVRIELSGLAPRSIHGLHVHEVGDCSAADASSAGGHFNPAGQKHGDRTGAERHAGDLGNVEADTAGNVATTVEIPALSVDRDVKDLAGRSVIVHAQADDLKGQPAGNSGARIACGVIRAGSKS